ncbi:MraY family glycosyltransferase [Burkholderia alba]|uniref:MraY family glycosyltransferase n=1 Tax=Burkholderia alba TaxID=2683677 RepID=UPI002B05247B|nr:glycosyltransferase family 4 protein [Burkholderia alba]
MLSAASACLICLVILFGLLKTGWAWRLATDIPNDRSMHTRPTPRVGGWGVVPAAAIVMFAVGQEAWLIGVLTLFLAAVSQIDDRRGLPARYRFAAHLIAAIVFVACGSTGLAWWWSAVLAIGLVWGANLYNFMDGSDGLAGGMACFGFGGYALAALYSPLPNPAIAWVCGGIAGAAFAFLLFNFHPARLFLGDAGSISLGFLGGTMGIWGARTGTWPVWLPVLLFAPFIADASVTLLRRLLRREKFWQAHRDHYYQRMVRSGIGHARVALYWYAAMLGGIICAWWALGRSAWVQWTVVAGWMLVLMLIGAVIDVRWSRYQTTIAKS